MEKILITGINGFIGQNLVDYILQTQKNVLVFGCDNKKTKAKNGELKVFRVNIRNKKQISALISKIKPDIIFHLSAVSSARDCEKDSKKCIETNVYGTNNILKAVACFCPETKIIIASSSYIYKSPVGKVKEGSKLIDNSSKNNSNLYGWTKLQNELEGKKSGLKVIFARLFNIMGPRRHSFWSDIIEEILLAKKNNRKKIKIDAKFDDTVRDYTDIRDIVKAFWLLAVYGKPGKIYNICSGRGYENKDIKRKIETIAKIGLKFRGFYKTPKFIGDSSRLKKLGWQPKIDILNQTLPSLLEHWRSKIR